MLERLARSRIDEAIRALQTYAPLASSSKPQPTFSFARALTAMADGGLDAGYEAEIAQEAARAAGHPHDRNRARIPWSAFATRDVNLAGSGAFLVSASVGAPVDPLTPWSVVLQAGITRYGNLRDNLTIPATDATSTITWVGSETTQVSPTAPTISQVSFAPKLARAVVQVSRQLLKQSDAEAFLRRDLLRAAGTIADQAVLNGSGTSGEPLGLLNTPNVGSQSGTSLAWTGLLSMKRLASDENAVDSDIAFIATPAVRELLEARSRNVYGDGLLWENDRVASCRAFASTLMPSATMICGPMSRVVLASWGGGIVVELNPNDPTLFKQGVTQIGVTMAVDVGITCDASAFTKAASIT